jgi:hypothetical protein
MPLCSGTVNELFIKEYEYNIPEYGFELIEIPFDGDDYTNLVA